jgi:PPOX class probable F420-dependent enzyme
MATLTEDQRAFLRDNAYAGTVTTLRDDGSPHTTIVWVTEENGDVVFNTARGRAKERHLSRDPRVSVLMVDPSDQYKWVSVSGRASLSEEDGEEMINRLSHKYLGKDYPWLRPDETRVTVRITPEKVSATGFE